MTGLVKKADARPEHATEPLAVCADCGAPVPVSTHPSAPGWRRCSRCQDAFLAARRTAERADYRRLSAHNRLRPNVLRTGSVVQQGR